MSDTSLFHTIVIGGGQAGLSASYWLKQRGVDHLVLEKADRPGAAWRARWDSFTLVTPNWTFQLPGSDYGQRDPGGYMGRDQIVASFEDYVQRQALPVLFGVSATTVEPDHSGAGFVVHSADGRTFTARNVIVATGSFQTPRIPPFAADLPTHLMQLHSGHYRRPDALPPGAVLVVGSGQSGAQIAEELYQSGRSVYLCVSGAGRAPRCYRGRDTWEWLTVCGFVDRTVDKLPSPRARFAANPHLSGRDGGHSLNLHQFARDGVHLLGRLTGYADGQLLLDGDLHEKLRRADQFEVQITGLIDGYIARAGLDAPLEQLPQLQDGFSVAPVRSLDLQQAGITSLIWAVGYRFDFTLVKFPVFDADGYPLQERGVTATPGLYFLGLNWLHSQKSGLLQGVGADAEHVVRHLVEARPPAALA